DYPSLIVLRSLTKSWRIPGLRFGFLATASRLEELERMQPPWSVNGVVHAWAREFLRQEHRAEYLASLRTLAMLRDDFEASLRPIPGITVHLSAVNFLLLELTDSSLEATHIYSELGRRGILVRTCDSFYGMPKGRFIRVAVRTAAENQRLVDVLSRVCGKPGDRTAREDARPPCERRERPIAQSPITNHQSPLTSHTDGRAA
ncbi:MAG: aminotransferase class I/II-fold pyridoxal phosphate-dependent enzyme, partial [Chthoniobacterales bacterium]